MINKIKLFFKRLFCKHEFTWCVKNEMFHCISGETQYLVCLKCGKECYSDVYSFKVFNSLNGMKEKGYFKGIDDNELIGDILAKCEVVG